MRHLFPRTRWVVSLFGLALLCSHAWAVPQNHEIAVQLFSSVDRPVVALGEAFVLDITAYASPGTPDDVESIRYAFEAGHVGTSDGLDLLRVEAATSRLEAPGEGAVVQVLRRQFVFRARQVGKAKIPAFSFEFEGKRLTTLSHEIAAFVVAPSFFEAKHAIFPIAATTRGMRKRRFVRTGSSFLIAPDAVVTSYHVVMDARSAKLTLPNGRHVITRKAWVLDPVRDIAILHIDPQIIAASGLLPLQIASTAQEVTPQPRDIDDAVVFTYGWPGGLQSSTAGLRYHAQLHPEAELWISANPVRPGDSGGPLLDRHGRVLGVVTSGTVGQQGLNEEVSVAATLRPALGRLQVARRPESLSRLMRQVGAPEQPHIEALRVTNMLTTRQFEVAELDAAMTRLDATLNQTPAFAQLYFQQGMIFQVTGQERRAQAAYKAALNVFDGHFLAAHMLATYHLRGQDYKGAELLFRYTARAKPYEHHATYGLARALMGRLRYAEAADYLQTVLSYDASFAPAYYYLARCYLALGDEQRAQHLQIPLKHLEPYWATRLRQTLRHQALRPAVLQAAPRAQLPSFTAFLPTED